MEHRIVEAEPAVGTAPPENQELVQRSARTFITQRRVDQMLERLRAERAHRHGES